MWGSEDAHEAMRIALKLFSTPGAGPILFSGVNIIVVALRKLKGRCGEVGSPPVGRRDILDDRRTRFGSAECSPVDCWRWCRDDVASTIVDSVDSAVVLWDKMQCLQLQYRVGRRTHGLGTCCCQIVR